MRSSEAIAIDRPAVPAIDGPAIPGVGNLRDVGGWPASGGRRVRTGLLYRSTDLGRLGEDGLQAFIELGIRRVFDLRTEAERRLRPDVLPDGTSQVAVDVLADASAVGPATLMDLLADAAEAEALLGGGRAESFFEDVYRSLVTLPSARAGFGRLLSELADAGHRPALVHCTTGKDRTGWAAAALLMFLGTRDELVLRDYLRSNEMLAEESTRMLAEFEARGGDPDLLRPLTEVREAYLDAAIDEMARRYGTVEAYFADGLSIDGPTRAALRTAFLGD